MLFLLSSVLVLGVVFTVILAGHDAPNAVALPVRARALGPRTALTLAAVMNALGVVVGIWLVSLVDLDYLAVVPEGTGGLVVLAASLLTASAWDLVTWWRGVPTSSSHVLSAGLIGGAAVLSTGVWGEIGHQVGILLAVLVLCPMIAMLISWLLVFPLLWLTRGMTPGVVNQGARMGLAVTSAANALGHGIQYGQRLYLVAWFALGTAGVHTVPDWLIGAVIALLLAAGTFLGGWRIARTLTDKLVLLDPLRASIASLTSALMLFAGSFALHLSISSSHTAVGGIVGAGYSQVHTAVRWPQVARMALYFVLTLIVGAAVSLVLVAATVGVLNSLLDIGV